MVDGWTEPLIVANMAHPPKRPRDANQLAKLVVDIAAGQPNDCHQSDQEAPMVTLGRSGGLKGGRARADALTSERRVEIARRAAAARWRENDS